MKQNELARLGVQIGNTFLRLPPGTTKGEWSKIAHSVTNVGYGYSWWLASLADYAEQHFDEKAIDELCSATGHGRSYIYMLMKAHRVFPDRQRVAGLSMAHHLAVIHLSKTHRKRMLLKAKAKSWSCTKLEKVVTPKEKRVFTLRIHVPVRNRQNKVFKEIGDFCDRYSAQFNVVGEVRHSSMKRLGKPMAAV